MIKFFKLSHGEAFFSYKSTELLKEKNLVSIHPNTSAKGQSSKTQAQEFLSANKGDLFYVCRSNNVIQFIGMFLDERPLYSVIPEHEEWVDREYVLIEDAVNPEAYNKAFDKWWSPKNNSTFTEVSNSDNNLFENEILKPVFNKTYQDTLSKRHIEFEKIEPQIEDYIAMQLDFNELMNDESVLFHRINALKNIELKKIEYTYLKRGDISRQPVVLLRSKLLELLLNNNKLDASIISQVKQDLDILFDTNVYHAWSSNFRILYTFLYDKVKADLETYFKRLINQLQKDLEIENETKYKLVHFDGAQNQGQDRLWFAIYNKINKSQKLAKQLFFEINGGLKYGLLNHGDTSQNELKQNKIFDYQDLLDTFKLFKQNILNDNSMEKAKLAEYIDILKYKKQIILQGPPGTGKTYTAKKIAEQLAGRRIVYNNKALTVESILTNLEIGQTIANASGKDDYYSILGLNKDSVELKSDRSEPWSPSYKNIITKYNELSNGIEPSNKNGKEPYELAVAKYLFEKIEPSKESTVSNFTLVQFHPSYSYEDFVRGISVKNENGSIVYKTENKVFGNFIEKASAAASEEDKKPLWMSFRDHLIELEKNPNKDLYFDDKKTIRFKDVYYPDEERAKIRFEVPFIDQKGWTMPTWIDIKSCFNQETLEKGIVDESGDYSKNWLPIFDYFKKYADSDIPQENNNYVLIIDEINRANLPSVLGELIYALEYRGQAVNSMYAIDGNTAITIPENLYIIGTMNTADRSVGHIDYAIKRRFAFVDILPNVDVITNEKAKTLFNKVSELFTESYLASDFDAKNVHLGHSYFLLDEKSQLNGSEQLQLKLDYEILPILNEYVKDGLLLETAKEKIKEIADFEC